MTHKAELILMITGDFDVSVAKSIFVEEPVSFRQKGALVRNIGNGLAVVNQYSSLIYTSEIEFEESVYREMSSFLKEDRFAPSRFSALRQVSGEIAIRLKCVVTPDLESDYEPRFAMDTHSVNRLSEIGGELVVDFVLKEGEPEDIREKSVN